MRKISVVIANRHQTSISLEDEFFEELGRIAATEEKSLNALITEIDRTRNQNNLSSAIRIYILKDLQHRTTPQA